MNWPKKGEVRLEKIGVGRLDRQTESFGSNAIHSAELESRTSPNHEVRKMRSEDKWSIMSPLGNFGYGEARSDGIPIEQEPAAIRAQAGRHAGRVAEVDQVRPRWIARDRDAGGTLKAVNGARIEGNS